MSLGRENKAAISSRQMNTRPGFTKEDNPSPRLQKYLHQIAKLSPLPPPKDKSSSECSSIYYFDGCSNRPSFKTKRTSKRNAKNNGSVVHCYKFSATIEKHPNLKHDVRRFTSQLFRHSDNYHTETFYRGLSLGCLAGEDSCTQSICHDYSTGFRSAPGSPSGIVHEVPVSSKNMLNHPLRNDITLSELMRKLQLTSETQGQKPRLSRQNTSSTHSSIR